MSKNWKKLEAQAIREMEKNKALIEAGETYRSQKKNDYRRRSTSAAGRRLK